MDLEKVFEDIRGLEQPVQRVTNSKAQVFGNDFINIFFLRSGYEVEEGVRAYYVIIENGPNPLPPTLMSPSEIQEKLGLLIDDYY